MTAQAPANQVLKQNGNGDSHEKLLADIQTNSVAPLWTQMKKLNPPLPNPQAIPFIWKYKEIRPNLLRAGKIVTEKQAERRVLMLVNPKKGRRTLGSVAVIPGLQNSFD